jgi:prepilin-type N-terminal cleavage/methylation domain-containing protein
MTNRNSFTLIELLVVIAILAGFVALLVPNFMQIRLKARDTKRKGDLFGIQKGLEMYKQSQSTPIYPAALPSPCTTLTDSNGGVYMQKVPQEPLTQCPPASGGANYYYKRDPNSTNDLDEYVMYACLENSNDPEGVACPADINDTGFSCLSSSGNQWCYKLTQP